MDENYYLLYKLSFDNNTSPEDLEKLYNRVMEN